MKPIITKQNITPLFESRYIKVFDLQYNENSHYYDATRRPLEELAAAKSDEEFRTMLPDAVTCVVILEIADEEPKLLLTKEFRYPAGQFLLSPPAGLLDPEDSICVNHAAEGEKSLWASAILSAAVREIKEETGIVPGKRDTVSIINPLLFSSPGMTDESNALVCAVIHLQDTSSLSQEGATGSECFDGFRLISLTQAREILESGRDNDGIFYSVYTWAALMYFISDLWR